MNALQRLEKAARDATISELHQGIHILNEEFQRKLVMTHYASLRRSGFSADEAKELLAEAYSRSVHTISSWVHRR